MVDFQFSCRKKGSPLKISYWKITENWWCYRKNYSNHFLLNYTILWTKVFNFYQQDRLEKAYFFTNKIYFIIDRIKQSLMGDTNYLYPLIHKKTRRCSALKLEETETGWVGLSKDESDYPKLSRIMLSRVGLQSTGKNCIFEFQWILNILLYLLEWNKSTVNFILDYSNIWRNHCNESFPWNL